MTPDCSALSFQKVKMATESELLQSEFHLTESTNIKCIFWSQKLKQGDIFSVWPKGKIHSVSNVPRALGFSKEISSFSCIARLYVFQQYCLMKKLCCRISWIRHQILNIFDLYSLRCANFLFNSATCIHKMKKKKKVLLEWQGYDFVTYLARTIKVIRGLIDLHDSLIVYRHGGANKVNRVWFFLFFFFFEKKKMY